MPDQAPVSAVQIRLASPETIRSWSSGEVTLPETVHYRTHKPVPDGLFCERIFGPSKDWTCFCGKYKRQRGVQIVCEKCGVELAPSRVRRERMGHIQLAAPVVHPWFASSIAHLLDLSTKQYAAVLACAGYLVTHVAAEVQAQARARLVQGAATELDGLLAALGPGAYLEASEYHSLSLLYGEDFQAGTGAHVLHVHLSSLDLDHLAREVRTACHQAKGAQRTKQIKRLQVIEALRTSGVRPEWMVLTILPVLPADLRPLVPLDNGRLATTDLNELYLRVLHRNKRVRHFQERCAPTLILHQEWRALQAAVSALIDNAHTRRPVTNARRQPLKSLTDTVSGKSGRFRLNLLGKRVDYSGRSVIVGNPHLRLHQCGLPKKMACELFKPFLIRKLVDRQLARNPRHAKRMVERREEEIWDLLAECLFERVVLLNRAPTLHRLSIQAFEPVLVEGSALQLHPQVCSAFNADFDGDQMAVHLPISDVAQAEARELLLSTRNLRSPASGEPSVTISQEQVLGLFYLTEDRPSPKRAGRLFGTTDEAIHALHAGVIDLHTPILVPLAGLQIWHTPAPASSSMAGHHDRVATTVGRLIFNEVLPEGMGYRNYPMTKETLKHLVADALAHHGEEATARMCDALKQLGFHYATRSGISFALSDIKIPAARTTFIAQGQAQEKVIRERYHAGEMTYEEWAQQVIALWTDITEQVSQAARDALPPYGTLMTIIKSGATKAKFQQIRQLSGMRGLMASPSGKILPIPVLSNYALGLLVWEIFVAASGARKGFMDRSLNTAVSGYLTRKLVEAGMSIWITQADCGATAGIFITPALCRRLGLASMRDLVTGRVLAEPIAGYTDGTLLTEELVDQVLQANPEGIWIRSPLTCQAPHGLCQHCYGCDPATGQLVRLGAAVGVVAGQSIGEPGTQLTMRTFHSGGIANAQGDITQGLPRVNELFEARSPSKQALLAQNEGHVQVETDEQTHQKRVRISATRIIRDTYPLLAGAHVQVRAQEVVKAGHLLASFPLQQNGRQAGEILARTAGRVETMTESEVVLTHTEREERVYQIPVGSQVAVTQGQWVEIGTPLTVGSIDPKALLDLCGIEAAGRYLVSEVQRVYRTTGVYIREQHAETIVRQMLRYVRISDEGDTALLPGEIVDRFTFEQINAHVLAQGGHPALAQPVLFGLTQTILHTPSWIAAASFQETSRVLTQAAMRGTIDPLVGLKENIILGLRIPIWTESAPPGRDDTAASALQPVEVPS